MNNKQLLPKRACEKCKTIFHTPFYLFFIILMINAFFNVFYVVSCVNRFIRYRSFYCSQGISNPFSDRLTSSSLSRIYEKKCSSKMSSFRTLVAEWRRIRPRMQGTQVQSLIWEESTCHRAVKPVCHNYGSLHSRAWELQLLSPRALGPVPREREATATTRSLRTTTQSSPRSL